VVRSNSYVRHSTFDGKSVIALSYDAERTHGGPIIHHPPAAAAGSARADAPCYAGPGAAAAAAAAAWPVASEAARHSPAKRRQRTGDLR